MVDPLHQRPSWRRQLQMPDSPSPRARFALGAHHQPRHDDPRAYNLLFQLQRVRLRRRQANTKGWAIQWRLTSSQSCFISCIHLGLGLDRTVVYSMCINEHLANAGLKAVKRKKKQTKTKTLISGAAPSTPFFWNPFAKSAILQSFLQCEIISGPKYWTCAGIRL